MAEQAHEKMLNIISHWNASKTIYNEISLHTSTRMAIIKKTGKDVKKLEPSYIADGKIKWYSHYRKVFGSY